MRTQYSNDVVRVVSEARNAINLIGSTLTT